MLFIIKNIDELSESFLSEVYSSLKDKFKEDTYPKKKESLCARVLLDFALSSECSLKAYLAVFEKNKKPYLSDNKVFFNISHSGKTVILSLSESETGCDVQIISPFNEKLARRFFTEEETRKILSARNKDEEFIKLWTLKESILKQSGKGLSGGLSTFDFSAVLHKEVFSLYGLNFTVKKLGSSFISVCSNNSSEIFKTVTEKDLKEFYSD